MASLQWRFQRRLGGLFDISLIGRGASKGILESAIRLQSNGK
jgi:hypothetical protein